MPQPTIIDNANYFPMTMNYKFLKVKESERINSFQHHKCTHMQMCILNNRYPFTVKVNLHPTTPYQMLTDSKFGGL